MTAVSTTWAEVIFHLQSSLRLPLLGLSYWTYYSYVYMKTFLILSVERRKIQHHNPSDRSGRESSETMETRSKYMKATRCAGKLMCQLVMNGFVFSFYSSRKWYFSCFLIKLRANLVINNYINQKEMRVFLDTQWKPLYHRVRFSALALVGWINFVCTSVDISSVINFTARQYQYSLFAVWITCSYEPKIYHVQNRIAY